MDPAAGAPAPATGARRLASDAGPLAALTVLSLVGTGASPWLLDHPLVLVAMAPRLPFLALAAGRCWLLPLLLVATVRLCVADPFYFRLGRRFGRTGRLHGRRVVHVVVAVRPTGRHLLWAGAAGADGVVIALIDVVATVLYVAAITSGVAAFG